MRVHNKLLYLFLLCIVHTTVAQDYFVIVKKNDTETYKFSENDTLTLYDEDGIERIIEKDDAITVRGDCTLKITSSNKKSKIIKCDGGVLEIYKLPINIRKNEYTTVENDSLNNYWESKINSNLDFIERKELSQSKRIKNSYNILLVFKEGFIFKFEDGLARAWENGKELEVSKYYSVNTSKGILHIKFNSETLETSWDLE